MLAIRRAAWRCCGMTHAACRSEHCLLRAIASATVSSVDICVKCPALTTMHATSCAGPAGRGRGGERGRGDRRAGAGGGARPGGAARGGAGGGAGQRRQHAPPAPGQPEPAVHHAGEPATVCFASQAMLIAVSIRLTTSGSCAALMWNGINAGEVCGCLHLSCTHIAHSQLFSDRPASGVDAAESRAPMMHLRLLQQAIEQPVLNTMTRSAL